MIPMVDLQSQYQRLKTEIDQGIADALTAANYILGPNVKAFEQAAADYLGTQYAISCASGTDALHLAIRAAGIGPGDEVITTPFTFIATAEAICYVGATPVFVDIAPDNFNIDVNAIEQAITANTKAVLPVHLFGQPANITAIQQLCDAHKLLLIEDCAQSFGAAINGKMTGSFGLLGCYSFFPSKNLGCYGDGGMLVTNNEAIAEQCLILRNHGSKTRYHHDIIGYNSRLDEIQAIVLRIKLNYINEFNQQRRRVAQHYNQQLVDMPVQTPYEDYIGQHVYHQYTLLSPQRQTLMQALSDAGIANAIYYPVPLHQQKAFPAEKAHCPNAEQIAAQCFSLPIFPEMTEQQIQLVTDTIKTALV